MQGYCYHFTTNPESINDINADDLYEANVIGPTDKCDDVTKFTTAQALLDKLYMCGLRDYSELEDFQDNPGWSFTTPDSAGLNVIKAAFFRKKFNDMKTLAAKITMDDFITYNNADMLSLEACVRDRGHDLAAFDNHLGISYMPLDSFIRKLQPNTTYYLSGHCCRMT